MDINEYPETLKLIRDLSTEERREWREYAWQVLAEAGSVPLEIEEPTHESYVESIITMAALSTLAELYSRGIW